MHGIADQHPGQTVRDIARLLCHGGDGAPRYVQGEMHGVLVPVEKLEPGSAPALAQTPTQQNDYLLDRLKLSEGDALYESTRISLRRRTDGSPVDIYELYWADLSRLASGGVRALSAMYQWMGPSETAFSTAAPSAAALGVIEWVNTCRSGDYVGRFLWTPTSDATRFRNTRARFGIPLHAL